MSVHRSFLVILAETISKFDRMSASPMGALLQLRRDKDVVRREIQNLLDRYAAKHGIPRDEARRLARGYIEDLVGDLFVDREEELDRELDREIEATPTH
jgi:hypothetical protein